MEDKTKKNKNKKKVILGVSTGVVLSATALGLGLGLGLNKKTEPAETVTTDSEVDNYPPLVVEKNSYPIKIIYETEDKIAEDTLFEVYNKNVLSETYLKYNDNWDKNLLKNKLKDVEVLIVLITSISKLDDFDKKISQLSDKPKKIHYAFEFNKKEFYNLIKEFYYDN